MTGSREPVSSHRLWGRRHRVHASSHSPSVDGIRRLRILCPPQTTHVVNAFCPITVLVSRPFLGLRSHEQRRLRGNFIEVY